LIEAVAMLGSYVVASQFQRQRRVANTSIPDAWTQLARSNGRARRAGRGSHGNATLTTATVRITLGSRDLSKSNITHCVRVRVNARELAPAHDESVHMKPYSDLMNLNTRGS
jgi:hypothetical protein